MNALSVVRPHCCPWCNHWLDKEDAVFVGHTAMHEKCADEYDLQEAVYEAEMERDFNGRTERE